MADLREIERESIRAFVQRAADEGYLSGRVLDYGCGKQPYRGIVEAAGGEYRPYDRGIFYGAVNDNDVGPDLRDDEEFDAILSTQTIQYFLDPFQTLVRLQRRLKIGGYIILTGPTNWPIVEKADKFRFTSEGISYMLLRMGMGNGAQVEERASIEFHGEQWPLGWSAIAQRVA